MKILITATALTATAAFVASALGVSSASVAAATPSPTPTATVIPTATPIPGSYLDIDVVHDLNKDGVRQSSEPGIAGARLHGGCGDALISIPATDSNGRTAILLSPYNKQVRECITLEHDFGWLSTTSPALRFDFPAGEQHTALFLIHDLGPDVMEVHGELILAGVPAPSAAVSLQPPFSGCLERFADYPYPLMYIVGAARSGCPATGTSVSVLLDGSPAGTLTYAAGRASRDLVARGDSMRMYGSFITAARISGVDCAVIRPLSGGGLIPSGAVRVFVLSEEVRPGCGAPGRPVRFYRNGAPLDPVVPWRAGPFVYPDAFEFVPATDILLPNTGLGNHHRKREATGIILAVALLAASMWLTAAGVSARRRL